MPVAPSRTPQLSEEVHDAQTHNRWSAPYSASTRGPVSLELGSSGMTDFSQCWLKHLEDSGAASAARSAPLLVTRPEAARMLSLSVPEIDNLRRAGRLLAKRHGKKVLFPVAELKRYADSLPWEVDLG